MQIVLQPRSWINKIHGPGQIQERPIPGPGQIRSFPAPAPAPAKSCPRSFTEQY